MIALFCLKREQHIFLTNAHFEDKRFMKIMFFFFINWTLFLPQKQKGIGDLEFERMLLPASKV